MFISLVHQNFVSFESVEGRILTTSHKNAALKKITHFSQDVNAQLKL
jgi:hypothetical protein